MKIAIVSHYNTNMFPILHQIACTLADKGHEVEFHSVHEPNRTGVESEKVTWVPVKGVVGWRRKFPILRTSYWSMTKSLMRFKPIVVLAENEFLLPALLYDFIPTMKSHKIIGYFSDYYKDRLSIDFISKFANRIDAYVDVCHMRLAWRQKDWSNMKAQPFVFRQAPARRKDAVSDVHVGGAKVVYTGSKHILGMNRDRISRFIQRLCAHGISFDWYFAETSTMRLSEGAGAEARSLCSSPLYSVLPPIAKSNLLGTLRSYDAGLFWAPTVEGLSSSPLPSHYFQSAASHKIGEYIAAGLIVAHTGNPGLSYLPDETCAPFDPTDPEAGADQLAVALSNRADVERKRQAALDYHLDTMNFEAQIAPLIDFIESTKT